MLDFSGTSSYAVFVYLCISIFVFMTMARFDERSNMLACPHHDLHECNCAQLVSAKTSQLFGKLVIAKIKMIPITGVSPPKL